MRHSKRSGSIAVKLACACAALSLSVACLAAEQSPVRSADAPPVVASRDTSFAGLMDEAMVVMQHSMGSAPMTGDPDHDFAAMMIPHHQGALDMAKAELLHGTNPVLRRLAQEIIVTQGSEITVMQTELGMRSSRGPDHP
jgi:uncharacterized protein (DUF305 family)